MPLCSLSPFENFKMVLSRISFSRSNIFKPKIRYGQPWVETPPTVLSSVVFHSFSRQPICQASPGRDSGHFFGHQRHHPRLHHEVSNRVCASSLDFHCLSYHENHLGDPINFINVISFTRFLVGRASFQSFTASLVPPNCSASAPFTSARGVTMLSTARRNSGRSLRIE